MSNPLNMKGRKKFWEFKAEAPKRGSLYIYGSIVAYKWDDTDVTAKNFKDELEALGDLDALDVYINSPGGSVFQGQAIYSILKRFGEKVEVSIHIDGLAASIASVIAMAGRVVMPRNAMMMVHDPWTVVFGNASELRKEAEALDKIRVSLVEAYMSKVSITEDQLNELLAAETWLSAQECYDYGFCDELVEEKQVVASVDPAVMAHYRNVPAELLRPVAVVRLSDADREARIAAAKENKANVKSILEVL